MADEKTYVYLMRDFRGYYKIGYSKNPTYREKTLQAEQPEILLIDKWEGSLADEKRLHKIFADVRTRGEWFKLSKENISQIYRYFCDKSQFDTKNELDTLRKTNQSLECDVLFWKRRAEMFEQKYQLAIKPVPPLELPAKQAEPKPPVFPESRRSLLEATKLSRLPSLPKRSSFVDSQPTSADSFAFKLGERHVYSPQPGVILRANTGIREPKEYTDEVPF